MVLVNFEEMWKRVILASTNETVSDINKMILDRLKEKGYEMFTHYGVDTVEDGDEFDENKKNENHLEYPIEWLHSLELTALPPYELRLTKGCPVMLVRNLNPNIQLSNGTRLAVESVHKHVLVCRYLNGQRKGEIVFIPNIKLDSGNEFLFKLVRKQFPVKPCFAMTINKSQGQTIEYVGIDMTTPVFSHGQCYVAFSRSRGWDNIRVAVDPEKINKVKNVVWQEALIDDYIPTQQNTASIPVTNFTTQSTNVSKKTSTLNEEEVDIIQE